jgi:hypothetical protein
MEYATLAASFLPEQQCELDICGKMFKPTRRGQHFCSTKCSKTAYMRGYRVRNPTSPDDRKRWNTTYKQNRPERVALSNYLYYNQKVRGAVIAFFGAKCMRCGFSDPRAFQIDHIHGDGYKDRGKMGYTFARKLFGLIQTDPDQARANYQLLCANCNQIKRVENGEHKSA